MYFGEASGVAVNSKGHVFVLSRGNTTGPGLCRGRGAAARIRRQRQVHPRDRQEPLRLVVRPHGEDRSPGQYLGGRQGLGHGHQVQSRGPRRHGVRPQAGSLRRRHRPAQASRSRRCRRRTAASARSPTCLGHGRQHLHQRRLHQFARRQGRQGRQLAEVMGRPRQGARPVQHPALHRHRRQGQRLCRRPRQPPHPGVRRRRQVPAPDHHRRAGAAGRASPRSATYRTRR